MTKNTLTYLHNRATEELESQKISLQGQQLLETIRHNQSDEDIRKETNYIKRLADTELDSRERDKLAETIRNNIATLNETKDWHLTQREMADLDREIKRLQLEVDQQNANTNAKKLENDLKSAVLRGTVSTLISSIPKLGLGATTTAALMKMFQTIKTKLVGGTYSNDALGQFAQQYAREHNIDQGILTQITSKLPSLSSLFKFGTIGSGLANVATTLTRSNDPQVSAWRSRRDMYDNLDRGRHSYRNDRNKRQDEDEIPDEIQIGGKTYNYQDYLRREKNNETSTKQVAQNAMDGNRNSNAQGLSSRNNFESSDDVGSKSKVIYSKGTEKAKSESGPGIGIAFA